MIGATWLTSRGSLIGLTVLTLANTLLMGIVLLGFVATQNF